MKLNILILFITVAIGFGLTWTVQTIMAPHGTGQAQHVKEQKGPEDKLPVFSMTALNGKTYKSTDFKGKTILLNFWASWCPPCVQEFPQLLEQAAAYPDKLVLIAVSSDQDQAAIIRFLNKTDEKHSAMLKQDNVIIVPDTDGKITFDQFQTTRLPETIVAGPDQTMLTKFVGTDWTAADVKKLVEGQ